MPSREDPNENQTRLAFAYMLDRRGFLKATGAVLVLEGRRHGLKGKVYDPPRLVIGALGHRDIVLGAVRLVLDATTLNTADRPGDSRPKINRSRLTATESRH